MTSRLRRFFDDVCNRLGSRVENQQANVERHPDPEARSESAVRRDAYVTALMDIRELLPKFELRWKEAAARYRRWARFEHAAHLRTCRELRNAYERIDQLGEELARLRAPRCAGRHDEFTYCAECDR